MKQLLLLLAASCVNGHLAMPGSSSPSSGAASASDAYARFAIQGIQLGTPLETQAGYTCGALAGYDGMTATNRSCVKFTDDRCKDRETKIHPISVVADTPKGQSCFMDENTGSSFLDRTFMAPPINGIQLVGTASKSPVIYRIVYTFAADDLTDDSKLGKALIAKYGAPSYRNAPIQMAWKIGDVSLGADCRMVAGEHANQGDFCRITVEDPNLNEREREHQRVADENARKQNAPPPPSL